jgi:hypothetical protein
MNDKRANSAADIAWADREPRAWDVRNITLQKLAPSLWAKFHRLLLFKGISEPVDWNLAVLVLQEEATVSLARVGIVSAFIAFELFSGWVVGTNINRKPRQGRGGYGHDRQVF